MHIRYQDRLEMMEKAAFMKALGTGIKGLRHGVKAMKPGLQNAMHTLGDHAKAFGGFAGDSAKNIWNSAKYYGDNIMHYANDGGLMQSLKNNIGGFGKELGHRLGDLGSATKHIGSSLAEGASPYLRTAGGAFRDVIHALPSEAKTALKVTGGGLAGAGLGAAAWSAMRGGSGQPAPQQPAPQQPAPKPPTLDNGGLGIAG